MRSKRRDPSDAAQGAGQRPSARALLVAPALLALCVATARAQTPPDGPDVAQQQESAQPARQREDTPLVPPPLRHLPEEIRSRLSTAKDLKARTKLSIEIADDRLVRAASHAGADRWDAATAELGIYEAVVRDAVTNLQRQSTQKNRHRDIIKRIEMALRSHLPRVETLRRGLPAPYAVHAQSTLDYVRDLRSETLNAFYDDTVIPQVPKGKPQGNERAKESTPANAAKP